MKERHFQVTRNRICLQQNHSKRKTKRGYSTRRKMIINRKTEMQGEMKSNGKCKYVSRSKWKTISGLRTLKTILKKKYKDEGLTLPGIRSYYKASIIKAVWNQLKHRQLDKWKKTESPEADSHYIQSFSLWQRCHCSIGDGGDNALFNKWSWTSWLSILKTLTLILRQTTHKKSIPCGFYN